VRARRDEARDVGHVGHHERAHVVRHGADSCEVELPRVRTRPDDDHFGPVLAREPLELLVIQPLIVLADAVRNDREELSLRN
jgi:hypothetical protein